MNANNNLTTGVNMKRQTLTIEPRQLITYKLTADGATMNGRPTKPRTFGGFRDLLHAMDDKQEAKDIVRMAQAYHFEIEGGRAYANVMYRDGASEKLPFTRTALQQFLSYIPGVRYGDMSSNWAKDEKGDKLAMLLTNYCKLSVEKELLVRTINTINGPLIRSFHSSTDGRGYQPFNNSQLLDTLVEHGDEYANATVLNFWLGDNGMRLRFAAPEVGNGSIVHPEVNFKDVYHSKNPISAVDLNNSETGFGSIKYGGGLWTPTCLNGITTYASEHQRTRKHVGSAEVLQQWMLGAIEDVCMAQRGVLEKYETALNTQIDNVFEWLSEELKDMKKTHAITDQFIDAVCTSGLHDPTTPKENGFSAASCGQAVALIAQQAPDFEQQRLEEQIAMHIMDRAISQHATA
tara:strand:+ start:427 stop:1641 length:1215 start_codon:yes stop_codon:yes gene_type:complete